MPPAASSLSSWNSDSALLLSRPLVGSSRNRHSGAPANATPRLTRRRSPPLMLRSWLNVEWQCALHRSPAAAVRADERVPDAEEAELEDEGLDVGGAVAGAAAAGHTGEGSEFQRFFNREGW